MQMKRILSSFLLYLLYTANALAEPRLLDRLIFEINSKSFSQRQIEIYHSLRTLAAGEAPSKALLNATNWKESIERLKNEMLVYSNIESDTQRMESFQPDNAALKAAELRIQKAQLEDPGIQELFKRLRIKEDEIQAELVVIYRVEAFIHGRAVVSTPARDKESKLREIDTKSEWFRALERLTPYRLYDGASEFVALQARRN